MIRAILDGRKTQTRRILNPQPHEDYGSLCGPSYYEPTIIGRDGEEREGPEVYGVYSEDGEFGIKCQFEPGMRLWVKTGYVTRYDTMFDHTQWGVPGVGFITTHGRAYSKSGKAKRDGGHPGMFMPQWLSAELTLPVLEITDVRVQRIQDISEADAQAEGVERLELTSGIIEGVDPPFNRVHPLTSSYADAFHGLWDSINGKSHPWSANEWCWAITFKRLEATS